MSRKNNLGMYYIIKPAMQFVNCCAYTAHGRQSFDDLRLELHYGYQLTEVRQLKRWGGGGSVNWAIFFAKNYVSEQSANYVEYGISAKMFVIRHYAFQLRLNSLYNSLLCHGTYLQWNNCTISEVTNKHGGPILLSIV